MSWFGWITFDFQTLDNKVRIGLHPFLQQFGLEGHEAGWTTQHLRWRVARSNAIFKISEGTLASDQVDFFAATICGQNQRFRLGNFEVARLCKKQKVIIQKKNECYLRSLVRHSLWLYGSCFKQSAQLAELGYWQWHQVGRLSDLTQSVNVC